MKVVLHSVDHAFTARVQRGAEDIGANCVVLMEPTSSAGSLASSLLAAGPTVVVIGPGPELDVALEVCEAIDVARPDVATLLVAVADGDTWVRALRAGARDVLAPDVSDEDLTTSLELALERASRRAAAPAGSGLPAAGPGGGRLLTVASPKGGSGKTMLTTNVAHGLQTTVGSTCIVDLDLQFGDVSAALGVRPEYTIANAVRALDDPAVAKSFLTRHDSGLFVLGAPENPAAADTIATDEITKLLQLLQAEFDWVVVDTGAGIDETTLTAIEAATDVMMVTTTDLAAIHALHKGVVVLDQIGLINHNRWYVLNRADARVGLAKADIERSTGLALDITIPSSRSVPVAMNQGMPVREDDPKSPAGRAIEELVHAIAPSGEEPEARNWLKRIRA